MNRIVHRDNSRELTGFWFEVPALFVPSSEVKVNHARTNFRRVTQSRKNARFVSSNNMIRIRYKVYGIAAVHARTYILI